jgi:hypothetical protein
MALGSTPENVAEDFVSHRATEEARRKIKFSHKRSIKYRVISTPTREFFLATKEQVCGHERTQKKR